MRKDMIAFFTPEVALDQSLHTYGGGLGFVSGDFLRSAYKINFPVIGVTILPRQGYYDQHIENGLMKINYVNRHYDGILERTGIKFTVEICSSSVWVEVWRLPEGKFGAAQILFLDADIDPNDHISRLNTLQLYGGSRDSGANLERKIVQSLLLARGGIEALKRLNISVSKYHGNESYTAFVPMELACEALKEGKSFREAVEYAKSKFVFTTHTPVRAGNPEYSINSVMRMGGYDKFFDEEALRKIGSDPFNMTAACLRLSKKTNAVSKKHQETSQKLWHWVNGNSVAKRIIAITNGVSRDYWQYEDFRIAVTAKEMEEAKLKHKREMIQYIVEKTGRYLSENVPTIIWAKRFAEYKRPHLLFYNFNQEKSEWIKSQLKENKLQIIYAGKPHPDDDNMIHAFNRLLFASYELPNLVVLSGYELWLSKLLKAGADVWLNNPRFPMEASGTSGMSAAMNGALNLSIVDGWMCEADPENYFPFGTQIPGGDQDSFDAQELKICLETTVMPLFYGDKEKWYKKTLAAKFEAEKYWTSDRMVLEYQKLLYID
ncbi:MAG: alpha-glucan family phosphorylase [Parcubacteria group bacterium]|nr:alpha-glucan family phosphorylase [Parcubacteria group bacterium]